GRIAALPPALLTTRIDEYALLRCSAAPGTAATWPPNLSPPRRGSHLSSALSPARTCGAAGRCVLGRPAGLRRRALEPVRAPAPGGRVQHGPGGPAPPAPR